MPDRFVRFAGFQQTVPATDAIFRTDQARLSALPEGLYTGIWWYARFPNHYAGEGAAASRELGEFEARTWINGIVRAIRAVKADQESLRLQNEFYERSKQPLQTPQ